MVQSLVALGRDRQRLVSVYEIQWPDIICSCMWRGHRWLSCVHLLEQRSLDTRSLYFRVFLVSALPLFCDGPEYLSRRFAKHFDHVVLRDFLRRMFEENQMVFVAFNDGPLGQSAWRPFAWLSYCRGFLRRGFASAGLGRFQDLQFGGSRLLCCNTCQSSRLAHLRRHSGYTGPLRASLHHRVVVLFSEHIRAGEHSWHHLHFDIVDLFAQQPINVQSQWNR